MRCRAAGRNGAAKSCAVSVRAFSKLRKDRSLEIDAGALYLLARSAGALAVIASFGMWARTQVPFAKGKQPQAIGVALSCENDPKPLIMCGLVLGAPRKQPQAIDIRLSGAAADRFVRAPLS
jgi:hypothetical protein